ncbi:MAG: leucine-rich repeat domain-containing protein, partial [Bacteroidales bacterium]|nr:leucine-rich repeat domain-containing protein [Bacteroidales bacterium]
MKKTLLILAALLCCCFALKAQETQEFTSGGLKYRVTGTNPPTVELKGYISSFVAHDFTIPHTVTKDDWTYSVTSIGNDAFRGCTNLTGLLTIPNSVTSIGDGAFWSCGNLTGTLTIPNSVTSIGNNAFRFCNGFTGSLIIPNSVKSIGEYAFSECEGFNGSLTIGNSVISIGNYAFYGCSSFTGSLTIGNSVTSIGNYAFYGCSSFTGSLTIPNSVTRIGEYAFEGCFNFTGSLTIPNSVISIEKGAFYNCPGFNGTLTIGSSVTSIGKDAFASSEFLNVIAKPTTPPNLGDGAFPASVPQSITVPCDSEKEYEEMWSSYASIITEGFVYDLTVASANPNFGSASITQSATCENDAQVTAIPSTGYIFTSWTENGEEVSTENPYTFTQGSDRNLVAKFVMQNYDFSASCSSGQTLYYRIIDVQQHLVSIVAPKSDDVYGWDENDKPAGDDITLPNTITHNGSSYTVTAISDYAFYGCDSLAGTLTIGSSVTSIGKYAFASSKFLYIIAKPTTPPALGVDVYDTSELLHILVPCDYEEDYTIMWSSYNTYIAKDFVYDLTVASANPNFGSVDVTQRATCDNDAQAEVTATPEPNCIFTSWTENGVEVSTENPYTFTQGNDRNLVANFTDQYDFTAICATGQKLYYKIIDTQQRWVSIVAPKSGNMDGWDGYTKPAGDITLPATVTHNDISYTVAAIGNCAFYGCDGLTGSLDIPNPVTSVGNHTFENCSGMEGTLTFGNSIKSIGQDAFKKCNFTGKLVLPESLEHIGIAAFLDCSSFTGTLTIPNSVTIINDNAFQKCSGFTGSLTIGNSVTSIGNSAFYKCSGFTGTLTIPNSVTSINDRAFQDCSGFTGSLTIGSSVTSIGFCAFLGCSGFTGSLTIPNSVESIGTEAFEYTRFTQIIAKPSTPPSLGSKIPNASNKVYIPINTGVEYETAWGKYNYQFISYIREDYHFNGTDSEWSNDANWAESVGPHMPCHNAFVNADCIFNVIGEFAALHSVTIAAGKTLTIAEDYILTADFIILENGAQLINNGTVVCNDLTMKKDIAGHDTGTGGWYLVSSPVGTIGIPSSMRAEPEEHYDLYRFEQSGDNDGNEWINAKAVEGQGINFYLEALSGYLYANKNNTTIVFRGGFAATETKELEYVEDVDFPGFNLIGNPYPCNARIGRSFYRMNTAGTELIA